MRSPRSAPRSKAPETEEAKRQIRARIQVDAEHAAAGSPDVDFVKLGLQDPRYIGHFGIDLASNLILNLLMFIAGIGLIRVKEWGRTLGVWVAALKIVRLLALTASMIVVVVPFVTQKAGELGRRDGGAGGRPEGATWPPAFQHFSPASCAEVMQRRSAGDGPPDTPSACC